MGSALGPLSTGMDDILHLGNPSWHAINYPYQLSLAILLWLGTVSTSQSWGINQLAWYTLLCSLPAGFWVMPKEVDASTPL